MLRNKLQQERDDEMDMIIKRLGTDRGMRDEHMDMLEISSSHDRVHADRVQLHVVAHTLCRTSTCAVSHAHVIGAEQLDTTKEVAARHQRELEQAKR